MTNLGLRAAFWHKKVGLSAKNCCFSGFLVSSPHACTASDHMFYQTACTCTASDDVKHGVTHHIYAVRYFHELYPEHMYVIFWVWDPYFGQK